MNNYNVLQALRETIIGIGCLTEKNVVIDYPDTDKMPADVVVYVVANEVSMEDHTLGSDLNSLSVSLFILCKGTRKSNAIQLVNNIETDIYKHLRTNQGLNHSLDFVKIEGENHTPCLGTAGLIPCIEMQLLIQFARDFR